MDKPLKITFTAKMRRSDTPLVFFMFDDAAIAAQPLFAGLSKSERQYLVDGARDLADLYRRNRAVERDGGGDERGG